ncbi:3-dehydroquinate synthase [Corynebacterium epidermidicanis]|uniref:3-dehydroquinate synthase n=1 Tax=Corynebacterium epidermidicanis TaxID=1050174 RepID=A0A0G3GWP5_9CORY|nr:3-dehydroquinate synthase [Corynebacterium epidermidicanis]AKK03247.1 3-dehydroquinate synthase [Corynebacterium epidermidicanis]
MQISVTAASPYEVHIGRDLTERIVTQIGDRKALLVRQPQLPGMADLPEFVVPDAEEGKSVQVLSAVWDRLAELEFGRRDVIVSLGGGAATDLAGFAAATWMRGIPVIHVPTSLLGMVDAAVGGKTGINTPAGKNLVGSFHEPEAVFVELNYLDTLPEAEYISGMAEIIKAGFIADPEILRVFAAQGTDAIEELIARAISVKAKVVSADLKEAGEREVLNYGHTFGHAIEKVENYSWRHGNAVAVGMMFEAELAHARGILASEVVDLQRELLTKAGLPVTYRLGLFDDLLAAMQLDKKNRDGHIRFVALTAVGETTRISGPSIAELQAAYAAISREGNGR